LAQWVSLALRKAIIPNNIKARFDATGIWPLNPQKLDNKMKPSKGFSHKPLDVQIQYILEEDVLGAQENIVHYFVDKEGESPFEDQQPPIDLDPTNQRHFSRFLRLLQQDSKSNTEHGRP